MEELFNAKPAKFPNNNIEEQNSVYKLLDLIDKTYVKPDPKIIDKFPNTDGEFTITDLEQYPIGKLDIQIKTLPKLNIESPKYQCELKFLKYCEMSLLPVLLAVVNAEKDIAYWYHMDRESLILLRNKLAGSSVVLYIPKENLISRNDNGYVAKWTAIVKSYITRKIDSEAQEYYKKKYEDLYNNLKNFPQPVHTIGNENLKMITIFLDTINNALDNDFLSIKEVKYHDFWKLSITYTVFTDKSTEYALIPIRWGTNDLLIREALHMNLFNDITSSVKIAHYRDNPIRDKPVAHAYAWIRNEVMEIITHRNLILYTEDLAVEYVTDFFDYYRGIFPFTYDNTVSVSKYLEVVEDYLPIWFEEYSKLRSIPIVNGNIEIDLDSLRSHLVLKDINYLNMVSQRRLDRGNKSAYSVKDFGKLTRYSDLFYSLKTLDNLEIKELVRPFLAKGNYGNTGFVSDYFTPEIAFQKLSFVYHSLPMVYDAYIKAFFPKIINDLSFFSHYDLLIVNVNYKANYTDPYDSPSIDLFHLQSNSSKRAELRIFFNYKDCPIQRSGEFKYFDEDLTFEGFQYRLKSASSKSVKLLYESFTLRETLQALIIERLESYFKTKTSSNAD